MSLIPMNESLFDLRQRCELAVTFDKLLCRNQPVTKVISNILIIDISTFKN